MLQCQVNSQTKYYNVNINAWPPTWKKGKQPRV
jgi:hypothetical protein